MAKTLNKSTVVREEEVLETWVKKKGKFLIFFDTEWWEKVSTEHIANDIHIQTDRPIRNIYFNGKLLISDSKF